MKRKSTAVVAMGTMFLLLATIPAMAVTHNIILGTDLDDVLLGTPVADHITGLAGPTNSRASPATTGWTAGPTET